MARFLSAQWVEAFNQTLAGVKVAPPAETAGLATRDGSFSMAQVVSAGPGGEVGTTLRVEGGRVTMEAGEAPDAAVTVRLSWDDAVALATGALSPAEAIAAGRVRVRGDLSVLAEAGAVLLAVQPQLGPLHDRTEY